MNGMQIDLRTIRGWVANWEKGGRVSPTASQTAAVMLSKALERKEERSVRVAELMKGIVAENVELQKLEKAIHCSLSRKEPLDPSTESELRTHRRRMAAFLKDIDEVLNAPAENQSILVGGLLFELSDPGWMTEDSA